MSDPQSAAKPLASYSEVVADLPSADRDEMAALGLLLDWELAKFLSRAGMTLVSQSFKCSKDDTLMVVKVLAGEAQYVVFVTRRTPMDCVRTFVRKLDSSALALYPDKFA